MMLPPRFRKQSQYMNIVKIRRCNNYTCLCHAQIC